MTPAPVNGSRPYDPRFAAVAGIDALEGAGRATPAMLDRRRVLIDDTLGHIARATARPPALPCSGCGDAIDPTRHARINAKPVCPACFQARLAVLRRPAPPSRHVDVADVLAIAALLLIAIGIGRAL